ncbi:PorT family protein [Reichenbachiella agarivorans]|uniref:PorT family protein n=1 Tax=Reichenbachiella agarivorans TaxID=2979464 RepID=A0ABY6CPP4_9BACT|nr:porin family protein [Reichenbachiella agarivorans]UXP32491.1 PorT family protein [Reichenbachiella agarivorans]
MKIRSLFSLLIILVVSTTVTTAQDSRKTYVGVKGGYNFSQVNLYHSFNGYVMKQGVQTGYQGGIIVMNYLRNHIGIQAELNYTQKGYIQKFDNGQPDYESQFNYVDLPFLFNLHTGKNKLHVFINAGCFFEYLINVESSSEPSDTGGYDFDPYDKDRDPNFGYGFRGGAGVFYDSRVGTFMLEGSFNYSLSNYLDPVTFDSGVPTLSNHYLLGITVGYLISFGELK